MSSGQRSRGNRNQRGRGNGRRGSPLPGAGRGNRAPAAGPANVGLAAAPEVIQPPVPAAQPPPPNPVRAPVAAASVTVQDRLKAYRASLPRDEALEKAARRFGLPYREGEAGSKHPLSHFVREALTARTLSKVHKSKGDLVVHDLFGSSRTVGIARFASGLDEGTGNPSSNRIYVDVVIPSAIVVPADIERHASVIKLRTEELALPEDKRTLIAHKSSTDVDPREVSQRAGRDFDRIVSYTDVYQGISPQVIADQIEAYHASSAIWMGHRFAGTYGSIFDEGAWMRVFHEGKAQIVSFPDQVTPAYGPHDPLDWIHSTSMAKITRQKLGAPADATLTWQLIDAVDSYTVYKFVIVDVPPVTSAVVSPLESVSWTKMSLPDLDSVQGVMASALGLMPVLCYKVGGHALWEQVIPARIGIVDQRVKQTVADWLTAKRIVGHQIRATAQKVNQELQKDATFNHVRKFFNNAPLSLDSIVVDSTVAAVLQAARVGSTLFQSLGMSSNEDFAEYNSAIDSIGTKPEASSSKWWYALLAGVAALALFMRKRLPLSVLTTATPPGWDFVSPFYKLLGDLVSTVADRLAGPFRVLSPDSPLVNIMAEELVRRKPKLSLPAARLTLAGSFVYVGIVGPFVEELVRSMLARVVGPWTASALFAAGDTLSPVVKGAEPQLAVAVFFKSLLLHRLLLALQQRLGFLVSGSVHAAHNLGVLSLMQHGAILQTSRTVSISGVRAARDKGTEAMQAGRLAAVAAASGHPLLNAVAAYLCAPAKTAALSRGEAAARHAAADRLHPWKSDDCRPLGDVSGRHLTPADGAVLAEELVGPLPSIPHSAHPSGVLEGPVDPSLSLDVVPHGVEYIPPVLALPGPTGMVALDPPRPGYIKVDLPNESATTERMYYAQGTNAVLQVPASTDHNLVHAMIHRALKPRPAQPLQQATDWLLIKEYRFKGETLNQRMFDLQGHQWEEIDPIEAAPRWLTHVVEDMGARQRERTLAAYDMVTKAPLSGSDKVFNAIETHVKTDEKLLQAEVVGGVAYPKLKPRLIQGPKDLASAATGPIYYEVARRLKLGAPMRFTGRAVGVAEIDGEKLSVYFYYAAGSTQEELSLWRDECLQHEGVHVATAGDDVYTLVVSPTGSYDLESDVTMCDQSLSCEKVPFLDGHVLSGPLAFADEAARGVGCPAWAAEATLALCRCPLVVTAKKSRYTFVINRSRGPQMPTGITSTTINNTTIVGAAVVFSFVLSPIRSESMLEALDERCKALGLSMKWQKGSAELSCTFLKGWWLPAVGGGYIWSKLPGQFVKLGVSRKAFELLVPKEEWASVPVHKRQRIAAAQFLRAQAKAEMAFVRHPLYTAWAGKVLAQSTDSGHTVTLDAEPWKVRASGCFGELDRDAAMLRTAIRYGCDPGDVLELEGLIMKSPLFTWLHHPLLAKMAFTDYA